MSDRPDLKLVEFSCNLISRSVLEKICAALEGTTDLEAQVRSIQEVVSREIPYARDAYSQLHHALAILEVMLPEISEVPQPDEKRPVWSSVLCELGFLGLLRQGMNPSELIGRCRGPLDLAALCRALLRSSAPPPLPELLDRAGASPYVDAFIDPKC